ncbi:MAG: hypothetical protein IT357_18295 [Gemmatimonadaceae bacterium]|nr:hypothetical protein [Gemmatimonadaceae bacterium]
MSSVSVIRSVAVLGAAALLLAGAACAGDEILGPPDAGRCVVGRLSVDAPLSGEIGQTTCVLWSPEEFAMVRADAWALDANANTAYLIRLIPTDTTAGATPLSARLRVYGRNEAGDVQFETASTSTYNWGFAGRNRELVLPVDDARPLSVRVETSSSSDSGRYVLQVSSCPMRLITVDSAVSGINSTQGCLARGMHFGAASRVTFLSLAAHGFGQHDFFVRREAGSGSVRATVAGYGLDFNAFRYESFRTVAQPITTAQGALTRNLVRAGRVTLALSVHADSGATMRALATPRAVSITSSTP